MLGLAPDGIVEDQAAAVQHVRVSVIEGLAQMDAPPLAPFGEAGQQAVARAVEPYVEVAAEGNLQVTVAAAVR